MIVRPRAGREHARNGRCTLGGHLTLEKAARERLDLDERLARNVGEDQPLVVVLAGRSTAATIDAPACWPSCGSTGPSAAARRG
jgi:hypothetical protein